jgi:hypothetical protein
MIEWHSDFAAREIMSGHMFRTRFRQQSVTEFLPPPRPRKALKADHPVRRHALDSAQAAAIGISLCKALGIIYPRYRGARESGGQFLEKSRHEDILDIIDDLPKGMQIASGRRFRYLRIESSSSEEASVVQRRFCCRLIRELGG